MPSKFKNNGTLDGGGNWQDFLQNCQSEGGWAGHANYPMHITADDKYLRRNQQSREHVKEIGIEDPLARRAIDYSVQMAVGTSLRIKPTPMSRMLGWNPEETRRFVSQLKDLVKLHLESDERWIDSQGLHNLTEKTAQHTRLFKTEGEAFEAVYDLPESRRSPLSFNLGNIDNSRIYTPPNVDDPDNRIRNGALISERGYHLGYYVNRYTKDKIGRTDNRFDLVPTRNRDTGRRQIIHTYLQVTSDLSRGISRLASCMTLSHQKNQYVNASLEDAIAKAGVTFVVTSNSQSVGELMDILKTSAPGKPGERPKKVDPMQKYMGISSAHHKAMGTTIRGNKIVRLLHGESLEGFSSDQAGGATFDQFSEVLDLLGAACHDMPLEEYRQKWDRTNYSGARSGKGYLWNMVRSLREQAPWRFVRQVLGLAIEDFILQGHLQLPGFEGRPFEAWQFFQQNKAAICSVELFGSPKDEIDRAKTADAYLAEGQLGVATWESYCNEILGKDWEEVLNQIVVEVQGAWDALNNIQQTPSWSVSEMVTHRLFGGNAFLARKNLRDLGAISEMENDNTNNGNSGDQTGIPTGS